MSELYDILETKSACTRAAVNGRPLDGSQGTRAAVGGSSQGTPSSSLYQIADKINAFDKQASEMTFVVIRIHSLRNGNSRAFQLPYNGKVENASTVEDGLSDVVFNLEHFPEDLICILEQFIRNVEASSLPGSTLVPKSNPRSPKSDSSKSFMKKAIKPQPIITLRQIDLVHLDKTWSMDEIIKYGEKSLFAEDTSLSTSTIDQIGLVDDSRTAPKLIHKKIDELRSLDHYTCYYCSLNIPSEWLPIGVYDCAFCSFHCARSYSIEYRLPVTEIQQEYYKLFGKKAPIILPSPDRRLLEKFGGSLNDEEYRNLFNSYQSIHTIQQSLINPICNTSDPIEPISAFASHLSFKPNSSSIQYKEAAKCSFKDPISNCVRIYKTK